MKNALHPAIIVALAEKADQLREICQSLGFVFHESSYPGVEDVIRFSLNLDEKDTAKLIKAVPIEIYAHRAVVTGE
jgi:hypothetical protein